MGAYIICDTVQRLSHRQGHIPYDSIGYQYQSGVKRDIPGSTIDSRRYHQRSVHELEMKKIVKYYTLFLAILYITACSAIASDAPVVNIISDEEFAAFALKAAKKQQEVMETNNLEGLTSENPKKLNINTLEDLEKVLTTFYTKKYIKNLWDDETMHGQYKFPKPHMWECDIANATNLQVTKKGINQIIVSGEVHCGEEKCKTQSILVPTSEGWKIDLELCGNN